MFLCVLRVSLWHHYLKSIRLPLFHWHKYLSSFDFVFRGCTALSTLTASSSVCLGTQKILYRPVCLYLVTTISGPVSSAPTRLSLPSHYEISLTLPLKDTSHWPYTSPTCPHFTFEDITHPGLRRKGMRLRSYVDSSFFREFPLYRLKERHLLWLTGSLLRFMTENLIGVGRVWCE